MAPRYTDHLDLIGPDRTGEGAVLILALVHNEANLLPDFLAHYRAFGDVSFLIVDDRSDDGSAELLAAQQDVTVLHPRAGSTYAEHKREWRGQALDRAARGRWILAPDVDEHLTWHGTPERGFAELRADLEAEGADALFAAMIDMYADAPLTEHVYDGVGLAQAFPFFDDPRRDPVNTWIERAPSGFLRNWPTPSVMVLGGMRHRLFGGAAHTGAMARVARRAHRRWDHEPDVAGLRRAGLWRAATRQRGTEPAINLTKVPLVKWRTGARFYGGAHAIAPAFRLSRERAALLHYPITRGMAGIEYLVARGQHADGARHYRELLASGAVNPVYAGSSRLTEGLAPFLHRPADTGDGR